MERIAPKKGVAGGALCVPSAAPCDTLFRELLRMAEIEK